MAKIEGLMNTLEINTKENKYLLDGTPITSAAEITIRLTPYELPEIKLTLFGNVNAKLDGNVRTEVTQGALKCVPPVNSL